MKKLILGIALVSVAISTSAQKTNTTNAGLAYQSAEDNFNGQNFEKCFNDLVEAKDFIDKAAIHEETKNDPKTLMYKGKIYIDYSIVGPIVEGKNFGSDPEALMETGFAAFKASNENDAKGRYEDYITDYCALKRVIFAAAGSMAFDEQKYSDAAAALLLSAKFAIAMKEVDTALYVYGGYAAMQVDSFAMAEEAYLNALSYDYSVAECVANLSLIYQKSNELDKADKMFEEVSAKHPNDILVISEKINYYLNTERNEIALEALNKAISLDPNNAELYYVAATVYQHMNDFENAEKSFLKTLEFDPKHVGAATGLGGLYFNKGADLNNDANTMDLSDPNYQKTLDASKANFEKAVPYLELAHENAPDDKIILESLKAVYGKLQMVDKFKEAKEKLAAME